MKPEDNPYASPAGETPGTIPQPYPPPAADPLEGLGGWLILVGFGVVLGPIRVARDVVVTYYPLLTDGAWEVLTTPGTEG